MSFLEVASVEIVTFTNPVKNGVASRREGGLRPACFAGLSSSIPIAPSSWIRGKTCYNFKGYAIPNAFFGRTGKPEIGVRKLGSRLTSRPVKPLRH